MIGSDHRPILATIDNKISKARRQFRLDKRWLKQEGFAEAIRKGWLDTRMNGESKVVDRIRKCRHEISQWRHKNKPYGKEKIADLQKALEDIQNDDSRTQEELDEITQKLKEAYRDEEQYWKQKSRNLWLKDGNLNTKFYHATTKQRRAINRLVGLHDKRDTWVT
ncbi:unnamed protein product [Microthlaspi erraticum]|uniref:Endonuclease/exonuclease/phosphatase domain-containing protein n=1 Tax=Microthlaspi erraticum TaxID=1685480 RepID=A0A6D2IKG1_9BRAS|nr:unnamed protein product [Microthlaspi erraticum]